MNRVNEKNLGTAPDNPSMGDINDITASTQEKTRSDTEQFRKFYGTYHKSVAADPVLQSTLPTKKNYTYTTDCANTNPTGMPTFHKRIQQLSLFHLTDGATNTNKLMPFGMHNSGSRIGDKILKKAKMR